MNLPSLINDLSSQKIAFAELSQKNGNVKVLLAIFDPKPTSEFERKAILHWDYGTKFAGCSCIMHA